MTLEAAAQIMDVSVMTALRMIKRCAIKGRQPCKGAPWVIKAEDVDAYRERNPPQRPPTSNIAQRTFEFQ
jgi:excisionase family DNA binding protein